MNDLDYIRQVDLILGVLGLAVAVISIFVVTYFLKDASKNEKQTEPLEKIAISISSAIRNRAKQRSSM